MFKDEFQYKIHLMLADIPSEILQHHIPRWLDARDLNRFSQTSTSYYKLFKDRPLKVAYLLKRVVKSNYDEVDAILEKDSSLLQGKGQVSDHCRIFEDITAFQYSLWALDWQMWIIMLHHFSKNKQIKQAQQQLEEFESQRTPYGLHYNLAPLIEVVATYVHHNEGWWSCDECEEYWNSIMVTIKREVPTHVANSCWREHALEYLDAIVDLNRTSHTVLAELRQLLMSGRPQFNPG